MTYIWDRGMSRQGEALLRRLFTTGELTAYAMANARHPVRPTSLRMVRLLAPLMLAQQVALRNGGFVWVGSAEQRGEAQRSLDAFLERRRAVKANAEAEAMRDYMKRLDAKLRMEKATGRTIQAEVPLPKLGKTTDDLPDEPTATPKGI